MNKENIAKSAIGVTIVMIIGYLLSFGKEALVAYYFGVSPEVDAYTIAIQVPVILFSFVAVAIQSVIVPLYSDILYNQSREKTNLFASNLIIIVSLFVLLLFVLGEVFASGLIYLFAPGFDSEVHELAVTLLRITLPTVFFSLIVKVYTAILNVNKKYVFPELGLLLLNIGLIITIVVLQAQYGIVAACLGQIVGTLVQFGFLALLIRKYFSFTFYFNPKEEKMKQEDVIACVLEYQCGRTERHDQPNGCLILVCGLHCCTQLCAETEYYLHLLLYIGYCNQRISSVCRISCKR